MLIFRSGAFAVGTFCPRGLSLATTLSVTSFPKVPQSHGGWFSLAETNYEKTKRTSGWLLKFPSSIGLVVGSRLATCQALKF